MTLHIGTYLLKQLVAFVSSRIIQNTIYVLVTVTKSIAWITRYRNKRHVSLAWSAFCFQESIWFGQLKRKTFSCYRIVKRSIWIFFIKITFQVRTSAWARAFMSNKIYYLCNAPLGINCIQFHPDKFLSRYAEVYQPKWFDLIRYRANTCYKNMYEYWFDMKLLQMSPK